MTKLLTWTLHAANTVTFDTYRKLPAGEPWYSKNYELVNPNGMASWDYRKRSFIEMIEKYSEKFYAIGLHEFGVNVNGEVTDLRGNFSSVVLNSTKDDIVDGRAVPTSLRYLMHNYPQIKWSLQFLCTSNSTGNRVEPVLDNVNGAQDRFIDHVFHVMKVYLDKGFTNIKGVEIDFEKTTSRTNEHVKFKDLLVRVKNEVCIPLGLELRVNMFAMTGDLTPSYYAWHDYATVASGKDSNGNQAVDEFQLMSYDFSWGGSAPGPSTPLWWLKQVVDHVADLEKRGLWQAKDVFIGNAGYGRRWPLGENRMGVTLDYKQLMLAQNGAYVHNPGKSTVHNGETAFWFNDQDFIPISGFNDEESDYQRTYLGVYDRFNLDADGGSIVPQVGGNFINRAFDSNYVTNYSRRQFPIFSGVNAIVTSPTEVSGRTSPTTGEIYEPKRTTGIGAAPVFTGYSSREQFVDKITGLPTGKPEDEAGKIVFNFSASGSQRLIAVVRWPFFDQADLFINMNGTSIHINGNKYDWNPFMQAQETHFVDLGVQSFAGSNTITVEGNSNGAVIFGFVVCSSFDYNMRGGEITFPAATYPMKRRDAISNDIVTLKDAQYPDVMRIVGEVLTRTPRPAIIWEDIFSSYVDEAKPSDDILAYRYYPTYTNTVNTGFTIGAWSARYGGELDYSHAYNDSRGVSAQLMLNKKFTANMAVDIDVRADINDTTAIYGVRALATIPSAGIGYACLLDFATKTVKIIYENADGSSVVVGSKPMSQTLENKNGQRIRIRVYVLNGKMSFWVEKVAYFDRITMPYLPGAGAYGIYSKNCRLKAYKYNVSTLDRWERMERMEVITGGVTYNFDELQRKPDTIFDEFGLIDFTCYPAEIADTVADLQNPDGGETGGSIATNTIIDTQVDPNFEWSNDYKNKALAIVPSWLGKQDVTIKFIDAGIWLRNFYVGDNEGMSVAYNSDRIGFIRTANFVGDYGCKGIALWTLGQEDPTIYSYIDKGE